MNRTDTLNIAKKVITKDRQDAYGKPEDCFDNIASKWSVTLSKKLSENITPIEVAVMMIDLKTVREINKHKDDNFVDIAGYAGLGNELAEKE